MEDGVGLKKVLEGENLDYQMKEKISRIDVLKSLKSEQIDAHRIKTDDLDTKIPENIADAIARKDSARVDKYLKLEGSQSISDDSESDSIASLSDDSDDDVGETNKSKSNEINEEGFREANEEAESSRHKRWASQQTQARKRNKVDARFLRDKISQLVTICSSWTSSVDTVHARSSIPEAIKLLESIPEVYDDLPLYLSCVELLEDSVKREVFISLGPARRIPYLRYCCERSNV